MKRVTRQIFILLVLIIINSAYSAAYSADQNAIRIRIGLKLFRTILASDTQIDSKKDTDGKLALAVIYKNNKSQADKYAKQLQNLGKGKKQGKIKGVDTIVDTIAINDLEQLLTRQYAGLYIVEELDNVTLQSLVEHGINHQIISYSPFSKDVEHGVSAGLIIQARVKPYVNLQTLERSQLQIKSFFMKVSKHYEP